MLRVAAIDLIGQLIELDGLPYGEGWEVGRFLQRRRVEEDVARAAIWPDPAPLGTERAHYFADGAFGLDQTPSFLKEQTRHSRKSIW